MGTPTWSCEAETAARGFPKGVRPLLGDRTRGLARYVGAHEGGLSPSGRRKGGILETGCRPTKRRAFPLGWGNLAAKFVAVAYRRLQ